MHEQIDSARRKAIDTICDLANNCRFRTDATVARPFPGTQSFTFPPTPNGGPVDDEELDEEAEKVRKAALEIMISLSEAKPAMFRRTDG